MTKFGLTKAMGADLSLGQWFLARVGWHEPCGQRLFDAYP